jgi:hypothetical protein
LRFSRFDDDNEISSREIITLFTRHNATQHIQLGKDAIPYHDIPTTTSAQDTMASVQTQTMTTQHAHPHTFTTVLRGQAAQQAAPTPATTSTTSTTSTTTTNPTPRRTRASKPLLSYSPNIAPPHPDINLTLLRAKLILTCRHYLPSSLLHEALADGIWSSASRWITPSSLLASKHGKRKRYYVLHSSTFTFQPVSSAWEARIISNSAGIDAGNGVVIFVRERREWDAFMRGYTRQGKRGAGQLLKEKQQSVERGWKEDWKRKCGLGGELVGEGPGAAKGRREVNAGPMWVLVKSAVGRIVRGEA